MPVYCNWRSIFVNNFNALSAAWNSVHASVYAVAKQGGKLNAECKVWHLGILAFFKICVQFDICCLDYNIVATEPLIRSSNIMRNWIYAVCGTHYNYFYYFPFIWCICLNRIYTWVIKHLIGSLHMVDIWHAYTGLRVNTVDSYILHFHAFYSTNVNKYVIQYFRTFGAVIIHRSNKRFQNRNINSSWNEFSSQQGNRGISHSDNV